MNIDRPFSNLPLISIVFNFSEVRWKIENNAYAKFWRDKKEYYGKFENGLFIYANLFALGRTLYFRLFNHFGRYFTF